MVPACPALSPALDPGPSAPQGSAFLLDRLCLEYATFVCFLCPKRLNFNSVVRGEELLLWSDAKVSSAPRVWRVCAVRVCPFMWKQKFRGGSFSVVGKLVQKRSFN